MVKRFFACCAATFCLVFASSFSVNKTGTPTPPYPITARPAATIRTVVIDPGHGGQYFGTTNGLFSKEKDITLAVSLKLGAALKAAYPDLKIVYTRTTDACSGGATNLRDDLHNRAKIANDAHGDVFISVHVNSTREHGGSYTVKYVVGHRRKTVTVGSGRKKRKKTIMEPIYQSELKKNTRVGTETYVWKAGKQGNKIDAIESIDSEDSLAEASAFDANSPEFMIRTQLYEKKFFYNSVMLAQFVEDQFQASGRVSYGVKQRDVGIQVLQATGMPSILVEIGFISNKEEEEYMNSDKGQEEIVGDMVQAFTKYKQQQESKSAPKGF